MTILRLATLFAFSLAACVELIAAPPATAPAPDSRIQLFKHASEPPFKITKVNSHIAIDEHITDLPYPAYNQPFVCRCLPDIYLLCFNYDQFATWNIKTHSASVPVSGRLSVIGKERYVLIQFSPRQEGPSKIVDVDPDTGQFRTLATSQVAYGPASAGIDNGSLFFIATQYTRQPGKPAIATSSLLQIKPDLTTSETPVELDGYACFPDAVRGSRILLCKSNGFQPWSPGAKLPRFKLAIFDIPTKKIRALGEVDGYWDGSHNNIIPACNPQWTVSKDLPASGSANYPFGALTFVREDNEEIVLPQARPTSQPATK